jgi:hypothetical protein
MYSNEVKRNSKTKCDHQPIEQSPLTMGGDVEMLALHVGNGHIPFHRTKEMSYQCIDIWYNIATVTSPL